jgi:hypothetical protein
VAGGEEKAAAALMKMECGRARSTGALNVGGGIVDSRDQVR